MIERAFKLKDAIDLYQLQIHVDEPIDEDRLTADDWHELKQVLELLKPLKKMSLLVQSDYRQGTHGTLWEALATTDYLMSLVEDARDYQLPSRQSLQSHDQPWLEEATEVLYPQRPNTSIPSGNLH
jgi:hypothetical protein